MRRNMMREAHHDLGAKKLFCALVVRAIAFFLKIRYARPVPFILVFILWAIHAVKEG